MLCVQCDVMSSGEPEAMGERVASFLNARMEALGLSDLPSKPLLLLTHPSPYTHSHTHPYTHTYTTHHTHSLTAAQSKAVNSQSFVLPNPPPKTKLKPNDIM